LYSADSTAGDGAQFDLNGGSATVSAIVGQIVTFDSTTLFVTRITALSTAQSIATYNNSGMQFITGTFTASSNGTFIVRAAQNTHSTGTLTISQGSWMRVWDMP